MYTAIETRHSKETAGDIKAQKLELANAVKGWTEKPCEPTGKRKRGQAARGLDRENPYASHPDRHRDGLIDQFSHKVLGN